MFMVDERDNLNVQIGDEKMDSMKIRGNCEVIITYADGVESFEATGMTDEDINKKEKMLDKEHNCSPLMEII